MPASAQQQTPASSCSRMLPVALTVGVASYALAAPPLAVLHEIAPSGVAARAGGLAARNPFAVAMVTAGNVQRGPRVSATLAARSGAARDATLGLGVDQRPGLVDDQRVPVDDGLETVARAFHAELWPETVPVSGAPQR